VVVVEVCNNYVWDSGDRGGEHGDHHECLPDDCLGLFSPARGHLDDGTSVLPRSYLSVFRDLGKKVLRFRHCRNTGGLTNSKVVGVIFPDNLSLVYIK
jgi:hypothetical protein